MTKDERLSRFLATCIVAGLLSVLTLIVVYFCSFSDHGWHLSKSVIGALSLLALVSVLFGALAVSNKSPKAAFGFVPVILFLGVLAYRGMWLSLPDEMTDPTNRAVFAGIIIVYGFILFTLREAFRGLYATIELAVAGVTGYLSLVRLAHDRDMFAAYLALAGSCYICVRAFDNFAKWRDERDNA